MNVAADDILQVFQQKIDGAEAELDQQRRLVESAWKGETKLHQQGL